MTAPDNYDLANTVVQTSHYNNEMSTWLLQKIEEAQELPRDIMLAEFEKLHMLLSINDSLVKHLFEENATMMDQISNITERIRSL